MDADGCDYTCSKPYRRAKNILYLIGVNVAVFLALFALFEVAVRFDSAEADICQGLRTGRLDL